ncbi:protein phosphatase 2C domain-containing protein [Romeria aff. gracilis LEGE 07310]|uniref:Protein phosphatase 2C domain-containing protein n=1 Tax=Vasconcelosia minhoensis LEGE 07310 TaxID=915328 RepID=A0A8J7ALX4_9CYAN|nr:protein phosphatase 2C domain-containing protein [Romeria gracilis]MBE9076636.1 protein phosphatase 2C domain-containing protein [Romeria aff. gracilis LEGE 07310]
MGEAETKYPLKQYVWALSQGARQVPIGHLVDGRYRVVAPSVWLDTQAERLPKLPQAIPNFVQPYLKAYPYQLHVPRVYGICHQESGAAVLLLDNVPIDRLGDLQPGIAQVWETTTPFRQVYWLWQILSLWQPLQTLGVATSLLKPDNIRIEGWRIRLIALTGQGNQPPLSRLAEVWLSWLPTAAPEIAIELEAICTAMQTGPPDLKPIKARLNRLLLTQATPLTLQLQVAGNTSAGPQQPRNEDACYPSRDEIRRASAADLPLLPRLAIVCDGVGGHEGGEVASQMAVRSLQLQFRSLLTEMAEQNGPMAPDLVIGQIEAAIRIANNLIATQNDQQGRTDRQRMGTTLVLALQLPQRIETAQGWEEVNELYIVHAGDSRAYWITPEYCQQLTVDDDIAGREVTAGRSFYATARQQPNAEALTQAVGTRDYRFLKPHIQRLILDEDGVLLLCSDGLSDNRRVEESWANYVGLVVKKIVPLSAAVDSWIELANQRNGHDNVAVVLMSCQVASEEMPPEPISLMMPQPQSLDDFTAASRALLYGEAEAAIPDASEPDERAWPPIGVSRLTVIAISVLAITGLFLWFSLRPAAPPPEPPEPERSSEMPARKGQSYAKIGVSS